MDEAELATWTRQVEARLRRLEGEPATTPASVQPVSGAITWQQLAGAYAKRYQERRGTARQGKGRKATDETERTLT